MLGLTTNTEDGFRRRNMPALAYAYFEDMSRVLKNVLQVTRVGASFALVVGPSRTRLGGVELTIDTPALLATVAEDCGWRAQRMLKMDAYQRYDLHSANSIRTERLLILKRC
jgi:site-specific DNA-methyltransferase (cytosine-N4-specific)